MGNKSKYYFTYGTSEGYPFRGGWSEVMANTANEAVALFNIVHPPRHSGIINCSSIYSDVDFEQTSMYRDSENFGAGCHEIIELSVEKR